MLMPDPIDTCVGYATERRTDSIERNETRTSRGFAPSPSAIRGAARRSRLWNATSPDPTYQVRARSNLSAVYHREVLSSAEGARRRGIVGGRTRGITRRRGKKSLYRATGLFAIPPTGYTVSSILEKSSQFDFPSRTRLRSHYRFTVF